MQAVRRCCGYLSRLYGGMKAARGRYVYLRPPILLIGLFGFYSGLPLALTASTLTAWLSDAKVERSAIGLFAAVATPYAFKFLWAPLVDAVRIPLLYRLLGRRRSWLVLAQCGLAASLAAMALFDPAVSAGMTALTAVCVALFSATQDTVIDAYRVERLSPQEQSSGAAASTFGYRMGLLAAGAGALALAELFGWSVTYLVMAGISASALCFTFLARSTDTEETKRITKSVAGFIAYSWQEVLRPKERAGWIMWALLAACALLYLCFGHPVVLAATGLFVDDGGIVAGRIYLYWLPMIAGMLALLRFYTRTQTFADFTQRPYWLQILAFVILYKLGDAFMGIMFNPFLLEIGFTKIEIAKVVKLYGLIASLAGAFAGAVMVARAGMFRTLLVCGILNALTNLLFAAQAEIGHDMRFLIVAVTGENFTGGMVTTAFIAYLSALCRLHYTATQYALLSSLAAFGRTWLSTPSGMVVDEVGWTVFFVISAVMTVPSIMLLLWLERKQKALPAG